nr:zinc ribbon domain-containing protein [Butyrivibrio sp. WCD3002]
MYCPSCGIDLDGHERFCPNCGYAIKGEQYRAKSQSSVPDNTQILNELKKINIQLAEGNRQRAVLAEALGQLISSGALLNFLK